MPLRRHLRILAVCQAALGVGLTLGLIACGSATGAPSATSASAAVRPSQAPSTSPVGSTSVAGRSIAPAASDAGASAAGCGTYGFVAPGDPDGVLAKLSPQVQQTYNGYGSPVLASPWANWKPTHQPPYTVGIAWTQPVNDAILILHNTMKKALQNDKDVGKIVDLAGAAVSDVPSQLQQYQSLVQQKVDLILLDPSTGAAFVSAVDAAAQAGIPTISAMSTTPTKEAVTVLPSSYLPAAQLAAAVMKEIGGKGNVLEVHGIPSLSIDIDAFKAFQNVLGRCPNVHVLGEVTGNFSPAQAKAATLQFLGTHPQPVDAVLLSGTGAAGVVGALEQAGRPVVPMTGASGDKGFLGYWWQHRSGYQAVANGGPPAGYGQLMAATAIAMLNGRGVKVDAILAPRPLITQQNLRQWIDPSWTLDTPGTASGPPGAIDVNGILKPVFNR